MLNESPVPGNKAQQPCCAKLVYRALQFLMQAKPPSCQYTVGARIGSLGKGSQRKTLGSLGPRVPRPPLRASPFASGGGSQGRVLRATRGGTAYAWKEARRMEDNLHMLKELQTHAWAEGAHSVLQIVDVQVRDGCLALLSLEARCDLTRFASERAASESLCHDLRCLLSFP